MREEGSEDERPVWDTVLYDSSSHGLMNYYRLSQEIKHKSALTTPKAPNWAGTIRYPLNLERSYFCVDLPLITVHLYMSAFRDVSGVTEPPHISIGCTVWGGTEWNSSRLLSESLQYTPIIDWTQWLICSKRAWNIKQCAFPGPSKLNLCLIFLPNWRNWICTHFFLGRFVFCFQF